MVELQEGIKILLDNLNERFLNLELIILISIFSLLIVISVLVSKNIKENF